MMFLEVVPANWTLFKDAGCLAHGINVAEPRFGRASRLSFSLLFIDDLFVFGSVQAT